MDPPSTRSLDFLLWPRWSDSFYWWAFLVTKVGKILVRPAPKPCSSCTNHLFRYHRSGFDSLRACQLKALKNRRAERPHFHGGNPGLHLARSGASRGRQ